jgi:hypothetical protein
MNKLNGVLLTMMMIGGMQVNAGVVNAPVITEQVEGNYVMMRVEESSEAIVGGNFDQYEIDISDMGFKKVFSVSLDSIEGYWGGTKELFVSRVNKNEVVIKQIKDGSRDYLGPRIHMMNTKVKMTVIKYTVLGL